MFAQLALLAALIPQTVSFEADAVQVKVLVAELAKQSGLNLVCDPVVSTEPIVADFKDQPVEDVLARLADLIGAEWKISDRERRLTRSSELKARQEREDRQKMAEIWRGLLEQTLKEVEALPKFDEKEAERMVNRNRLAELNAQQWSAEAIYLATSNPVARYSARLLSLIGPETISRMAVGERIVFSDLPTPMQRQLPLRAKAEIDTLKSQATIMVAAKERVFNPQRPFSNIGGMADVGPGDPDQYGKTLVAVGRTSALRISYLVVMVDREGKRLLGGSGQLPDAGRIMSGAYSHRGKTLEVSEEVRAFAKLQSEAGVAMAMGSALTLPDGTKINMSHWVPQSEVDGVRQDRGLGKYLADPVQHDPLGFVFGRLIRQVAGSEQRSLLATAPDIALFPLAQSVSFRGVSTTDDLIEFLTQSHVPASIRTPHAQVEKKAGWLIVKPALPSVARNERFNRESARDLIRAIRAKKCATLTDAVRYISRRPVAPSIRSIDRILIGHADPSVDRSGVESLLQTPIDFIAGIGPSGWGSLEGPGTTYGRLPPGLKNLATQWVYWSDSLQRASQDPPGFSRGSLLSNEPTETLPNGIPGDAPVRLDVKEIAAVIAHSTTGHRFNLSVYSLAWFYTMSSSMPSGMAEPGGEYPQRVYDLYLPATQRLYTITILLPGGIKVSKMLVETIPLQEAKEVKREQLPQAYLKAIAEAKDLLSRPQVRPPR